MSILEQHHGGLFSGRRFNQIDQGTQRLVLVLLRGDLQRPVARFASNGQDRGDKAHIASRLAVARHHQPFELVEFRFGGLVALELQQPLEVVDAGPEGAVQIIRRALVSQRLRTPTLQPFTQRAQDAALADARLSGQQHHLTFAVLSQRPALEQQPDLLLAPHERREPSLGGSLEAAGGFAHAHDSISMSGLGDALQMLLAQVLVIEAAASQSVYPRTHHDAAGLRDALQSGGQIHRLACGTFF